MITNKELQKYIHFKTLQRLRNGNKQVKGGQVYKTPPRLKYGEDWVRNSSISFTEMGIKKLRKLAYISSEDFKNITLKYFNKQ